MTSSSPLSLRQIMNRIYEDLGGFKIPKEDAQIVKQSKGSPIYGEINHQALGHLLDYLRLGPKDVFYDLGSGVGKVIVHSVLATKVGRALGVELSKVRYQEALTALKRAQSFEPRIRERLKFLNQDLLTTNLGDATVIYTCSTAFSQLFMNRMTERLLEFKQPYKLVSLQELPENKSLKKLDTLRLDMSWMRKSPVHIYQRQ